MQKPHACAGEGRHLFTLYLSTCGEQKDGPGITDATPFFYSADGPELLRTLLTINSQRSTIGSQAFSVLKLVRCPHSLVPTLVTLPSMSRVPRAPFAKRLAASRRRTAPNSFGLSQLSTINYRIAC